MRKDLTELASHAVSRGMRAVISTNGTLISREKARELKSVGLSYVGISLDGGEEVHDRFRGVAGAYKKALAGIENCQHEGLKVGLRFTINKRNASEVPLLFDLLRDLEVPRICFYHLVYAGRGSVLVSEVWTRRHARPGRLIWTAPGRFRRGTAQGSAHRRQPRRLVPTSTWPVAGRPGPRGRRHGVLSFNEGNNSAGASVHLLGRQGHADKFWRNHVFGNVRERPFSRSGTIQYRAYGQAQGQKKM